MGNRKILVVDDNQNFSQLMQWRLRMISSFSPHPTDLRSKKATGSFRT